MKKKDNWLPYSNEEVQTIRDEFAIGPKAIDKKQLIEDLEKMLKRDKVLVARVKEQDKTLSTLFSENSRMETKVENQRKEIVALQKKLADAIKFHTHEYQNRIELEKEAATLKKAKQ